MRLGDRRDYLRQTPKMFWDILFRGHYDFTYDLMPVHTMQMPMMKRLNLLRSGANLVSRRLHPWGWPIHMHIELANYCNLKCEVCPTGIGKLDRQPLAI